MSLSSRDCRLLLTVIDNLYASRTSAEFLQATREGLASLVTGDCFDFVLFGSSLPEEDAFFAKPGTYTEEEMRYMLENVSQHPLARAFFEGDPGAICISQMMSPSAWHNSRFYRESGYQRLGLRHEMAALIPDVTKTSFAAVSILRGRDFSARDREVLNRLRFHFGRAWRLTAFGRHEPSAGLVRRLFSCLGEREAEVLFWMTEGKQNREIAEILERSLNTVQEHVENINRKLGAENRNMAVVMALRALLEGSSPPDRPARHRGPAR